MGVYVVHKKEKFFIDLIAEHSHDHNFTTSAWDKVVEILSENNFALGIDIMKLVVWSDGGLKTKENLYYFSLLAQKHKIPNLHVNFFAPYHGHSEVRNFANLKEKMQSIITITIIITIKNFFS